MKVSIAEAEIPDGKVVQVMQDTDAHHLQAFFVVIRGDHETVWSAIARGDVSDPGSIDDALSVFSRNVREYVLASI